MNIFVNPNKVKNLRTGDLYKETSKSDWKEIIEIHHYKTRTHIFYQNLEMLPKVVGALKVYYSDQVVEHLNHSDEFKQTGSYYSDILLSINDKLKNHNSIPNDRCN